MKYGSVCSGIEAATMAWEPLGWKPAWFSEIEKFPSAVLQHHYPEVPNHGDFTRIRDVDHPADRDIDLLVGGTPCQDFSVAGLRAGLDGARGQLTLEFCRLVGALRPRWVVWENVPGVLSANGGRAFGSFLGALAELGYGFSWRVLDAQFFGLAQRRKRVFVVAHSSGDWRRAAAVLFEPEGVYGDPPTRGISGQDAAGDAGPGVEDCRGAVAFSSKDYGADAGPLSPTLRSAGHDGSHANAGAPPAVAFNWMLGGDVRLQPTEEMANALQRSQTQAVCFTGDTTHALKAEGADASEDGTGRGTPVVAFLPLQGGRSMPVTPESPTLEAGTGNKSPAVFSGTVLRRLTPVECERLQGFPDDFTKIQWGRKSAEDCPDGPRYKALGNSMAVPVMRWIGRRIDAVDRIR